MLTIFLQRPDNGNWTAVGHYSRDKRGAGEFVYDDDYLAGNARWAIDPCNLPLSAGSKFVAPRYAGIPDVLRDISPDSWGRSMIRHDGHVTEIEALVRSGNADRWGALAVSSGRKLDVSKLVTLDIETLDDAVKEILAVAQNKPALNSKLRSRIISSIGLGGARPKFAVRDGEIDYIVKPTLGTDSTDIAQLEAATSLWGTEAELNFAETTYCQMSGNGVVLVRRFDRAGGRRQMTISGASLLQVQYPPVSPADISGASYPRLADALRRMGAPVEDLRELFGRMIFNAMVGNDDDHCRNHAAYYRENEGWRLAPAFDVVPNPEFTPTRLQLQLGNGKREISRCAILSEYRHFGFPNSQGAEGFLSDLLDRIVDSFYTIKNQMPHDIAGTIEKRILQQYRILSRQLDLP